MLPFGNSEVYVLEPRLSLAWAAPSRLRFAIIIVLLVFTTLPFQAQEKPIPAELAFLNKLGKPYRITYELWTEMQIPQGNRGMNGVGKVVRGKHGQFPGIVLGAKTPDAIWAFLKPPPQRPSRSTRPHAIFLGLGPLTGSSFSSSDYEGHSLMGHGFQGQDHTACSVS